MEFNKLITERYSVRKFKQEHLKQEVIDKILEAGHKARKTPFVWIEV